MEDKIKLKRDRRLDDKFVVVYCIRNKVNKKYNEQIRECFLYTFIGINSLGKRTILDIVLEKDDDHHFWLDIFESFKERGLKYISFIAITTNKDIERALRITYPNSIIIVCLTDLISSIYQYVGYRGKNTMIKYLKEIYVQETLEDALSKLTILKEYYSNNVIVSTLLNEKINSLDIYYTYDINVRMLLFNHYKGTEFFDKIKSWMQVKQYITSNIEVWEFLYDFIEYFEKNKSYSKNNWTRILNSFISYFPDYLKEITED